MANEIRVLVVDADDTYRTSLAAVLREHGYAVMEAHHGVEGLPLARERPPELVVLDPWPYVSAALQMVARLKDHQPEAEVLLLRSAAAPAQRACERFVGVRERMDKPGEPGELLGQVERARERLRRPGGAARSAGWGA